MVVTIVFNSLYLIVIIKTISIDTDKIIESNFKAYFFSPEKKLLILQKK